MEVGIGIRGRGEAHLLEVGRDGGEGEDLEAEDVDAVLRVVLHLVLLLRFPLAGGNGGGALPDHEPASHHRAVPGPAWTSAAESTRTKRMRSARDGWDLL